MLEVGSFDICKAPSPLSLRPAGKALSATLQTFPDWFRTFFDHTRSKLGASFASRRPHRPLGPSKHTPPSTTRRESTRCNPSPTPVAEQPNFPLVLSWFARCRSQPPLPSVLLALPPPPP
ncbi:hypothetical protein L209DRAFT_715685, partial [Thermothelomyces heterothallicus CBS 203.75]